MTVRDASRSDLSPAQAAELDATLAWELLRDLVSPRPQLTLPVLPEA